MCILVGVYFFDVSCTSWYKFVFAFLYKYDMIRCQKCIDEDINVEAGEKCNG